VDVEIQLQVLEELSSTQLIIQMLKKESTQEDATITSNQSNERKPCTADYWEVKTAEGKKGRSEGKLRIRNNELIGSKSEMLEMRSRYSALATDEEMQESENKMNTWENPSRITTSKPKTNIKYNKQERNHGREKIHDLTSKVKA
jgi:hypothetical protein